MIWLWLAIMLAGWSIPAWRWLKRRRAAGWPIADSRIEFVEVSKPTFSFKTKRGYYVAELGYSYSIAGSAFSGHYRRDFPTERKLTSSCVISNTAADSAGIFFVI